MDPSSDIDLHARTTTREGLLRRAAGGAILWLHRQADRLDLVPGEFGDETPVDPGDPWAVAGEWRRQLRLWAAYNPEEVLALKAGAAALGAALIILAVVIGAID